MTGFSDWDSMFYNNLLSIPVLLLFSLVIEDWSSDSLDRNLYVDSLPLPSAGPLFCLYAPLADAARPKHVAYSSSP